ncbi:hypothetical protein [Aurantimonas sp. Leaf443]|uniref:hypothetical protein n=1 Tax=Aurantimonas sp. Leaf443 TaxID=1736378 RepID=UPI000A7D3E12|nr:hypothetical protein [Aurantimonas sp. Leaf443]
MKRPLKPFVVEHKRRTRAGVGEPPSIWSGALGEEIRTLVKAGEVEEAAPEPAAPRRRARAAAAEAEGEPAAKGRILMAREEPAEPQAESAEPAPEETPRRRRGRPPGSKSKPRAEAPQAPRPGPARESAAPTPAAPSRAAAPDAVDAAPSRPLTPAGLRYLERRAGLKEQKLWQRWKRK